MSDTSKRWLRRATLALIVAVPTLALAADQLGLGACCGCGACPL